MADLFKVGRCWYNRGNELLQPIGALEDLNLGPTLHSNILLGLMTLSAKLSPLLPQITVTIHSCVDNYQEATLKLAIIF